MASKPIVMSQLVLLPPHAHTEDLTPTMQNVTAMEVRAEGIMKLK